jgi:hypothetical protein
MHAAHHYTSRRAHAAAVAVQRRTERLPQGRGAGKGSGAQRGGSIDLAPTPHIPICWKGVLLSTPPSSTSMG